MIKNKNEIKASWPNIMARPRTKVVLFILGEEKSFKRNFDVKKKRVYSCHVDSLYFSLSIYWMICTGIVYYDVD